LIKGEPKVKADYMRAENEYYIPSGSLKFKMREEKSVNCKYSVPPSPPQVQLLIIIIN
jgi:hypothetical protein